MATDSKPTKLTGILGGSFDPIHLGHTHLLQELLTHYHFQRFFVVPAKKNPDKNPTIASPQMRLEMTRVAIKELRTPSLKVLDWEIQSRKPSYSLLTIQHLLAQGFSNLTLVMGDDVFQSFPAWYQVEKILSLVNLIVVSRAEKGKSYFQKTLKKLPLDYEKPDKLKNRIIHGTPSKWIENFQFSPLPFSSTKIRKALLKRNSDAGIDFVTLGIQRSVWKVIKENRLYAR